jgi:glycosyltransferase involved in cell wall biosynthesis
LNVPIDIGSIGVDQPPAGGFGGTIEWDAVFIGRHVPEKGVFDALEIWRRVVERSPGRRLVLAGSASPPMHAEIERRIRALRLDAAVARFGQVDEDRKWQLYRQSRLCLFPSRAEGWGLVPLEALACGIPVVAYDLPAYAENIAHGPGSTLCPVGDHDAAARAVLRYLEGERPDPLALQAFTQRFSWETAVTHEEALLERLLSTAAVSGSS